MIIKKLETYIILLRQTKDLTIYQQVQKELQENSQYRDYELADLKILDSRDMILLNDHTKDLVRTYGYTAVRISLLINV